MRSRTVIVNKLGYAAVEVDVAFKLAVVVVEELLFLAQRQGAGNLAALPVVLEAGLARMVSVDYAFGRLIDVVADQGLAAALVVFVADACDRAFGQAIEFGGGGVQGDGREAA